MFYFAASQYVSIRGSGPSFGTRQPKHPLRSAEIFFNTQAYTRLPQKLHTRQPLGRTAPRTAHTINRIEVEPFEALPLRASHYTPFDSHLHNPTLATTVLHIHRRHLTLRTKQFSHDHYSLNSIPKKMPRQRKTFYRSISFNHNRGSAPPYYCR